MVASDRTLDTRRFIAPRDPWGWKLVLDLFYWRLDQPEPPPKWQDNGIPLTLGINGPKGGYKASIRLDTDSARELATALLELVAVVEEQRRREGEHDGQVS